MSWFTWTFVTLLVYGIVIFMIAQWAERKRWLDGAPWRAHMVYALGLGAYCTSWTFYGSVGKAVAGSWTFVTIYLGPSLCALFWGDLLRRLIRAKHRYQVSSVPDLLVARYGKWAPLGALATIITLIAAIPYIALQIRALRTSYSIASGDLTATASLEIDLFLIAMLVGFSILYGTRHLRTTQRNDGMMVAIAFESIFKLFAFMAVGIFATFAVCDGFGDAFARGAESFGKGPGPQTGFMTWVTLTLLSGFAFVFLPRQFHVSVVENANERHVWTARAAVPVYLFLINIFVVPLAAAGLAMGLPASSADSFVIAIPKLMGQEALSTIVFLGGVSAALGMVTLSSITLALMVCNHLVLPILSKVDKSGRWSRQVMLIRRLTVFAMIGAGYLFARGLGDTKGLVSLGIMAFAAIAQFAPAVLGALYWRGGSRRGAFAGLSAGFAVWIYTLLLPTLSQANLLPDQWLTDGLFGLSFLRPTALFGLQGLDMVSHAVLWSLSANLGAFIVVSHWKKASNEEQEVARELVALMDEKDESRSVASDEPRDVQLSAKLDLIRCALVRWLSEEDSEHILNAALNATGLTGREHATLGELSRLSTEVEKDLGAVIGVALAHSSMRNSGLFSKDETAALTAHYASMMAELQISPYELRARVEEYRVREEDVLRQAAVLEGQVAQRTSELESVNGELLKAKAAAESANDAKSQFLSNMSHEIRTPMTAILGSVDLALLGEIDPEEVQSHLKTVQSNGEHLLTIVSDILDLSKIEAGRIEIELLPTDLHALVRDAALLMRPKIEGKGLRCDLKISDRVPQGVMTDPTRLRQIILNLMGNAAKFTSEGGVQLTLKRPESHPEWIQIEVSDSGIGIAPDALARLFDPFHQADASTTRKFGGTGLGLTISKKLAGGLGGDLVVRSKLEEGSVFTVTIPANVVELAPAAPEVDEAPLPKTSFSPEDHPLLLVEDNAVNQRIASMMLERAGYPIEVAENGAIAIEKIEAADAANTPYAVVLMDMMMPVMDGYEATERLRKAGNKVPIIALTAHAMQSERDRCMALGCDDFATKPYRREALLESIDAQVRRSLVPDAQPAP